MKIIENSKKKLNISRYLCLSILIATCSLSAQVLDKSWQQIIQSEEGPWFASQEAKAIAENVLLFQRNIGGWPKNIQMQKPLSVSEKEELINLKPSTEGCTTDNGATCGEMLFLSKIYRQQPDPRYKEAFINGVNYLLEAQYENGGWPQFYPLKKGYYTHITYNDDSMVNILNIFKALKDNTGELAIQPTKETIKKIKLAFDKGIDCILKTQYKQHGILTSWCAQYDENTFLPAKARAYELPSLSGKESVNIVLLLMSIENPSPEIINAVSSAVIWFDKVRITGIRQVLSFDKKNRKITSKKIIQDPNAPPLWARFMELDDNTPFFCDRDGIKKYALSDIGEERRNGYAWYTNEPEEVFKEYEKWKKKFNIGPKNNSQNMNPQDSYNITVSKDGTGDYANIQDAINGAKSFPYDRIIIHVKNGIYHEKVKVHEWNTNISLIGESKENTVITYDDYFGKLNMGRNSTFYTYTMLVEADDFYAANLTIQNTSGKVGQAVALSVISDRVVIKNCNLLGNQDTLYTSGEGKQYFKNCYIEGTTDFIFGNATALFENCEIHSKSNSYVTAASTPKGAAFGYVFKNCKLTADNDVTEVYLGRPWRIYAQTVFINCQLGKHISPQGWHNWSKPEAEETTFYAEFQNSGDGFQPQKRVPWSKQLTAEEAEKYTLKNILSEHNDSSKSEWYEGI